MGRPLQRSRLWCPLARSYSAATILTFRSATRWTACARSISCLMRFARSDAATHCGCCRASAAPPTARRQRLGVRAIRILDQEQQSKEEWRAGVTTRMQISAVTGSAQLCIFQQWCEPGLGAPTHLHAVEEVLTVLEGQAEIW